MSFPPPPPQDPSEMPPPPPPPPGGDQQGGAPAGGAYTGDFGVPGSDQEKMSAALAQGAGFIGMGIAILLSSFIPGSGLIGNIVSIGLPIYILMQNKNKSTFVVAHCLQALHWAALGVAIVVGSLLFTLVTAGLGFCFVALPLCLFGLAAIVLAGIATYKAYNGEPFRYPITGNWTFLNQYLL